MNQAWPLLPMSERAFDAMLRGYSRGLTGRLR